MGTILVTGAAGFIGFHLIKRLLKDKKKVIGIDNLNEYYDQNLKLDRLKELDKVSQEINNPWEFSKGDIEDKDYLTKLFDKFKPEVVIHLAAQAGVRYSITNPQEYINSNILGFFNVIENSKNKKVRHFIYASSSSVYGGNLKTPFSENDQVNHPVSLYAATKKSNELLAHTYSHLYNLRTTGLRFFTVYGPWGRPDMAPMLFTKAIIERQKIKIFNHGNLFRDFTFIDDIIEGICLVLKKNMHKNKDFDLENPKASSSWAPYRIFNIGNSKTIKLVEFVNILEDELGIKAIKDYVEMQPGDVLKTYSDISLLKSNFGYQPKINLQKGIKLFINWYKEYYKINN